MENNEQESLFNYLRKAPNSSSEEIKKYEEKGNSGRVPSTILYSSSHAYINNTVVTSDYLISPNQQPETSARTKSIPVYGHYSMEYKLVQLSELEEKKPFNSRSIVVHPKIEVITSQGGIIQTNGLKITIPKDAVKNGTQFSIKQAPSEIELPEYITPVTPIYAVEPHNVELNDLINLAFTIQDASEPVALFIQKENPQDKKLKKWLAIEPKKVENDTAIFEIRSCSFPFVGKMNVKKEHDLSSNASVQQKFQDYNIIRPGLNYRASCEDPTCSLNKELMIINRGFGDKISPNEEIDSQKLTCFKCKKSLNDYESIKQLILFRTIGDIKYRLDIKPRPSVETVTFSAMGDRLIIYGEVGDTEKYSTFTLVANPQPFNPKDRNIALVTFDDKGNPIGSIFDLGVDGAFRNVKLLIGKFYDGNYIDNGSNGFEPGITKLDFEETVGKALDEKGFDWKCTEDEDEFLIKLPDVNVAWVIGCSYNKKIKNSYFVDSVIKFHKKGNGLMLWEDNDPLPGYHTTAILQKLFGMSVEGCDEGQKNMIAAADCSNMLTFSKSHPIMTGVKNLYEGNTISHPNKIPLPSPIKVLATSSANHPNIMYVDETEISGRVVIDCGFTKLYKQLWDTAGTARYVKNATCWLSGFPYDSTM